MSQPASFFTNIVFPGLLISCGCLGLVVVNYLGQQSTRAPQGQQRVARVQPPPGGAGPRVAALQRKVWPKVHHFSFAKQQTRVMDTERERLRIFLAVAKPGTDSRVAVVGHGVGPSGRRLARKRAERVLALLRQLGVAASIAGPKAAPEDGGARGSAVTIVIRKR
jgi:outer membrane protein OmpA-like peptidoglycan-associated protein